MAGGRGVTGRRGVRRRGGGDGGSRDPRDGCRPGGSGVPERREVQHVDGARAGTDVAQAAADRLARDRTGHAGGP
ncbi:MAG: hypothetical protein Q7T67_09100, partial [Patulibacter sp.]